MLKRFNPEGVAPPFSNYSHGVLVTEGMRVLHVSGQVGVAPDGTIPDDPDSQTRNCFENVLGVLAAEGMTAQDLVSITTYAVAGQALGSVRQIRDEVLGGIAPASTFVYVSGLADPRLVIEVQAVAAKAG
jgi:enamine deaminase RidA (YjgF/YER057c/UK114 family)